MRHQHFTSTPESQLSVDLYCTLDICPSHVYTRWGTRCPSPCEIWSNELLKGRDWGRDGKEPRYSQPAANQQLFCKYVL